HQLRQVGDGCPSRPGRGEGAHVQLVEDRCAHIAARPVGIGKREETRVEMPGQLVYAAGLPRAARIRERSLTVQHESVVLAVGKGFVAYPPLAVPAHGVHAAVDHELDLVGVGGPDPHRLCSLLRSGGHQFTLSNTSTGADSSSFASAWGPPGYVAEVSTLRH